MSNKTPVTSPFLPPLEEFVPYLQQIWDNKWLTNNGPFHQQLEAELAAYLGVEHLSLFANGTLALVTALQALRIGGEVITTPYTFAATSHSLLWNGIKPVFVDIDPSTCNLDPDRIEEAITPATTAILPVHCYGIPCNVERIERIADTYGLKVIYDAAHAFGVRQNGSSILQHGDLSILSFHATKVFNTFEGGAIVCPDAKIKQRIDYLKNFGFANEVTIVAPGINGKMNEVSAAMGLLQLRHIDAALGARATIFQRYAKGLAEIPSLKLIHPPSDVAWNHAYCPVLVSEDYPLSRDELYELLKSQDILARRYFYPLISSFPMYRGLPSAAPARLAHAAHIAEQIICLPIFPTIAPEEVGRVIGILHQPLTKQASSQ
ncbi:DegT/DnrJ/EryC1/StrS family aminotransferase [Azoarcus indigens]|uniref:dTDP-4-amino-4,6-dideoxygalactose transaminase n=1 Tax=Azoarcus indigens TaxID=29545 RepID=A0A4R6DTB8_9RHOO|nr:DegT/DnrJ/EryC1/StrS family aminotransferase [Azoarcus indigens]NMG64457.1 DegT/DnrJ/EryC1/StrS family aminotransferase [Azoarcus indigens]TDN48395.1 dTDP-4-amino-4,6-dideoxygalactose transaminase [Azoarcus indigens]